MHAEETTTELSSEPALREAFSIVRRYPLACFGPAVVLGLVIQLSHEVHPDKWIGGALAAGLGVFAFTLYLAYVEEVALEAEAGVERIGVVHSLKLMRRTGPVLFAVAVATGIALLTVGLGLIGFVVGLWLLTRWSLCVPAISRLRLGPKAALLRSNALVRGAFWPVFATATVAIMVEQMSTALVPVLANPFSSGWGRWILGAAITSLVMPITGLVVSASYNRRAEGAVPRLL